jgi:transposase InsO family protein
MAGKARGNRNTTGTEANRPPATRSCTTPSMTLPGYRSRTFAAARGPDIRHQFTRPYRPQTNGKMERCNPTLPGNGRTRNRAVRGRTPGRVPGLAA